MKTHDDPPTSVLILGAGFGGLEAASRLAASGEDLDITLIDRADSFVFGFSKLDLMFGRTDEQAIRLPYADMTSVVRFRQESVTAIDPGARRVTTDLDTYEADVLIVALGADYDLEATPGLAEHGQEFYSMAGAREVASLLPSFIGGRVLVGVCGQPFKCPPAPSETCLLLDDHLRAREVSAQITLAMPFGRPVPPAPETSDTILSSFAERGITFVPDAAVASVEPGTAIVTSGERLTFDLFLAIPVHRVPDVVAACGLAVDGWIPVDKQTLATSFEGVYAIGDCTSVGTAKAGVFAEGQGRVVADQLLARLRGEPLPTGYDGTGSCLVELGAGQVAQLDVDFFSDPSRPIATSTQADPRLKVEFAAERRQRWLGG